MKIEDMNFPIEVEFEEGGREYKIKFIGRKLFKRCCNFKLIHGSIEYKDIPNITVKGFNIKEISYIKWRGWHSFNICYKCGEYNDIGHEEDYCPIARKAWLKVVKRR